MGRSKNRVNAARLQIILDRQKNTAFGADYQPATRAIREEAPSRSRAFQLLDTKVARVIHLLSLHELAAVLIALYIKICIDIHEQKMLWTEPHTHPLFGYPGVDVTSLPAVSGTAAVADRLGYLDLHPVVRVAQRGADSTVAIPYPLLGDLLLILRDAMGVYCVDWMIKRDYADFRWPPVGMTPRNRARAIRKAVARTEMQIAYHADAKIRTQLIAYEPRLNEVVSNLRVLHAYEIRPEPVSKAKRADMIAAFQAGMAHGVPPIETYEQLARRCRCTVMDCQTVLFQAIWRRELRVDLYQPIFPDYPLDPETKDLLLDISDWYRR